MENTRYENFKAGMIPAESLNQNERVAFLIMIRAEKKTIEDLDKQIQEVFKNDDNFKSVEMEGVKIAKVITTRVSLLKDANLVEIREKYPEICKTENVLHQDKLTERVWDYLKEQEGAVEEQITVDAKKLHEVNKAYTTQTLSTSVRVTGV